LCVWNAFIAAIFKSKNRDANNYPQAWQRAYAEPNYLAIDPTVTSATSSLKPMVWSDELFASCRLLWEDARAHDLNVGWAQPSHDVKGVAGLLTLARSSEPVSAPELRQNLLKMSWLAQAAHEGLPRLISLKAQSDGAIGLTAKWRCCAGQRTGRPRARWAKSSNAQISLASCFKGSP
jgi:LuxR family transcriptional regulator